MEAGLSVDFNRENANYDTSGLSKLVGEGRYENEAWIHVIIGLLSLIPVIFLVRAARNNTEISKEKPFFALLYFTLICSLVRTVQHIFYLIFVGTEISINKCTIIAHIYYVAEVLPQQMTMIVLVNSYFELFRGRSLDLCVLGKIAASILLIATLLNIVQFWIGTPSPNFPLCLPYNIDFHLNDVYHHFGFLVLFANVGMSAYLCFGHTTSTDGQTSCDGIRQAVHFSLFVYSSCCLGVILPLAFYTHLHEFSLLLLSVSVNSFEFFHSMSAGVLSSVILIRVPYLRTSIIDSLPRLFAQFH